MAKPTTQDEKKVVPPPPPEGEPKPATGSAAEAALKKEGKLTEAETEQLEKEEREREEAEQQPKEVAYTEPVTQVVPAPNPAYKQPQEPPFGSKRLKDEMAAGKKSLESIESNKDVLQAKKDEKAQPKPGTAPAAQSATAAPKK
jgi:hypothetical protein